MSVILQKLRDGMCKGTLELEIWHEQICFGPIVTGQKCLQQSLCLLEVCTETPLVEWITTQQQRINNLTISCFSKNRYCCNASGTY